MKARTLLTLAPLLALETGCISDYKLFGEKGNEDSAISVDSFTDSEEDSSSEFGEDTELYVEVSCDNFKEYLEVCLETACDGKDSEDPMTCEEKTDYCYDTILGDQVLDCCGELEACLNWDDSKGAPDAECLRENPIDPDGECCVVYDFIEYYESVVDPEDYEAYIPEECFPDANEDWSTTNLEYQFDRHQDSLVVSRQTAI